MNLLHRVPAGALVFALALPSTLLAQPGRGGRGGGSGPNPVAPLIDLRRELDLSARQLVALDSIERSLDRRNRDIMTRLANRRDSTMLNRDARELTEDDRAALQARMRARRDSMQPLFAELRRNDSTARAAALRVLTDSQRVRVREFQAERRGYARGLGMGSARRPMDRGFAPRRGDLRGQMGPRGRFDRGRDFGPRPGIRPGDMGPRGQLGPRGMGRGMGPRGMGPGEMGRGRFRDETEPVPRRRIPPTDSVPR